jgi:hypothetical protein
MTAVGDLLLTTGTFVAVSLELPPPQPMAIAMTAHPKKILIRFKLSPFL